MGCGIKVAHVSGRIQETERKDVCMAALENFRVAVLATDGFEEAELTEPAKALGQAGAKVEIISLKAGKIQAFQHLDKSIQVPVDLTIDQANPQQYDALLLPGGALNADKMRAEPKVQQFVRAIFNAGKPMAVICHAPWELVSAKVARGRTLTSYYTIQDDIRNAGGNWVDQEVVVDGNIVTSRQPSDIPAFNREMIRLFSARRPQAAAR
jgi:protease I